jgi:hypothetical protein
MRPGIRILLAVSIVMFFSSAVLAASKAAAPAAEGDSGKITLTYDNGKKVTCLTPQWASGGTQMNISGSIGKAKIGGKSVAVSGWQSAKGCKIGLDSNGDSIVNTQEFKMVPTGGSVVLIGKIDDKELAIRCSDVAISYDAKAGEVRNMRWRMQGVYGWVGQIGSVDIRILDENLDGKYGHDGKDAIQIGKSRLALPLRGKHRIGQEFYKLKISEDGSSLEYTRLSDVAVGLVRTPFPGKFLVGLVLDGKAGAFDIQACSKSGIPAGDYNVVYGVVGNPRSPIALYRGRRGGAALKYNIQADMKNLLRIGPPLQLVFNASYKQEEKKPSNKNDKNKKPTRKTSRKQVTHKISVNKPERVIGAAGEEYGPLVFPNVRSPRGRPGVIVYQGSKILTKTVLPEREGNLQGFTYELPRKFSPASIRVMMIATVGGLGKVSGVRTLKQIYDKEVAGPPKTDKPAVTTTPWKRPGKPARIAVKPKPKPPITAKPKPTVKPVTKPVIDKPKPKPPKVASSDELKASRLLKLARSYEKMNLNAKYVQTLKKAIEKYPNTKSALAAQALLTAGQ